MRTANFAAFGASLVAAGVAAGAFTGLAATSLRGTTSGGLDVDVFELFATFDSPADAAAAVGGTPLFPQTLDSGGGGFFQVTLFGAPQNVANPAAVVRAVRDLAFDSFLSIGVRQGFAGNPQLPTIQNFALGDFNGGASTVVTTNGGWFVGAGPVIDAQPFPPALPPGAAVVLPPGATQGVMLGQFTVTAGNTFAGDLGQLLIFEDGRSRIVDRTNGALFSFSRPLPGPGAALLLLALVAPPRRRAG